MEEEQTHNGQKKKDKQRSEKNMHKTNDLYCNNLGPTLYFFFFMKYEHAFHYLFSLLYAFFYSSACTKPGK